MRQSPEHSAVSSRPISVAGSPRRRVLAGTSASSAGRAGFSLVELMIAIMILGLGMVMAATVFPVSLDMTRGTVQLNIAEAAADAAVATLALRVPRYKNLDGKPADFDAKGFPVNATPRVALADMTETQKDFRLEKLELILLSTPLRLSWRPLPPSLLRLQELSAFLTEMSFWDAEYAPANRTSVASFVVRSQNLTPDLHTVHEQPPSLYAVSPTNAVNGFPIDPRANVPAARISVADRVYPPVDMHFDDTTFLPASRLAEIAQRRYSWTAIHFRDLDDQAHKSFFVRIVVLYRGNTSAYYAKQRVASTPTDKPEIDDTAPHTLFPQAWLVLLKSVTDTGVVTCTPDVARLLPSGSYIILAEGNPPGAYTKILRNNWDGRPNSAVIPTLQITPGDFPTGTNVPVWVFPPAVRAGNQFESSSPVVSVVPKKVVAG